jgi:hypothetical protein
MAMFFIALLVFCFYISNTWTIAFVAVVSAITVGLVVWCIRLAWVSTEDYDLWHQSKEALRRTRVGLIYRVKEFVQDFLVPFSIRRAPDVLYAMHSSADRQDDPRRASPIHDFI